MQKIKMRRKLKPAFIKLSDINRLCSIFIETAEEDSPEHYKREANFEIVNTNEQAYQFSVPADFIEQLENDLPHIKNINLSYFGHNVYLSLRFDAGFSSEIYLDIETTYKATLLGYEDKFLGIFIKKSWNSIIRNPIISFILATFFTIVLFLILSRFNPKVFLALPHFIILTWFGTAILITGIFRKLYPALVLIGSDENSGRIFKKDWWKLASFLVTLIIIPMLLNLVLKK
jgi:hypothetical protein